MITFTVPQKLRRFIRRPSTPLLFSPIQGLFRYHEKTGTADEKYIGGDLPGFLRRTCIHGVGSWPTIPISIMSSPEALYPRRNELLASLSRIDFYLPVKAMSKIFKAKFRHEMSKRKLDFQSLKRSGINTGW